MLEEGYDAQANESRTWNDLALWGRVSSAGGLDSGLMSVYRLESTIWSLDSVHEKSLAIDEIVVAEC